MKTASLEAALQGWEPGASGVQASVVGGPKVKGSFLLGTSPQYSRDPTTPTTLSGNSLVVQWLGLCSSIAGGMGSIPD